MYELYDKNGNQIGYQMTKRIKNEDGKYDVLTARSKTSEKDCRKKLDDMVKEYYQLQEKKKSGGVFSEMKTTQTTGITLISRKRTARKRTNTCTKTSSTITSLDTSVR